MAAELGLRYLDTGAMYRALTWWLREQRVDLTDTAAVLARLSEPRIEVGTDPAAPQITRRRPGCGRADQDAARCPTRSAPWPPSRRCAPGSSECSATSSPTPRHGAGIVAEGRDIGTVVAPDAAVKVYLTASEDVRARRRSADLADPAATVGTTRREQARRDQRDAAQMVRAEDAVEIDTSLLGLDDVVGRVVDMARAQRAVSHG